MVKECNYHYSFLNKKLPTYSLFSLLTNLKVQKKKKSNLALIYFGKILTLERIFPPYMLTNIISILIVTASHTGPFHWMVPIKFEHLLGPILVVLTVPINFINLHHIQHNLLHFSKCAVEYKIGTSVEGF